MTDADNGLRWSWAVFKLDGPSAGDARRTDHGVLEPGQDPQEAVPQLGVIKREIPNSLLEPPQEEGGRVRFGEGDLVFIFNAGPPPDTLEGLWEVGEDLD